MKAITKSCIKIENQQQLKTCVYFAHLMKLSVGSKVVETITHDYWKYFVMICKSTKEEATWDRTYHFYFKICQMN